MLNNGYGPHGAEEEHEDFWTDLAEGADMLPGGLPAVPPGVEMPMMSETDPLGSWTGAPEADPTETPTQDADDL